MLALAVIACVVTFGLGLFVGYTAALASLSGTALAKKLMADCTCADCRAAPRWDHAVIRGASVPKRGCNCALCARGQ